MPVPASQYIHDACCDNTSQHAPKECVTLRTCNIIGGGGGGVTMGSLDGCDFTTLG